MKNCPKCGRDNRDDATMCRECGARLDPVEEKITCPICGTENLSDAKFCDKCGKQLGVDVPNKSISEASSTKADNGTSNSNCNHYKTSTKKESASVASPSSDASGKNSNFGVVAAIACVIVLIAVLAVGLGALENDDSDNHSFTKIDDVNAKPLDGTYHLSGGIELKDGTEYWTVAEITFDDGRLVSKNTNTAVKEVGKDWDSNVSLTRPIVRVNSPDLYPPSDPIPEFGYLSVEESIVAHNPFLDDMTGCNDKYLKLSSGQVKGYGFEDSNGNIYYLLKDGTLAGYTQSYNGHDVLTVFDYRS